MNLNDSEKQKVETILEEMTGLPIEDLQKDFDAWEEEQKWKCRTAVVLSRQEITL